MLVTSLPNIDGTISARSCTNCIGVCNLAGGVGGTAYQWLLAYLGWANDAVRALRLLVSSDDRDSLTIPEKDIMSLAWIRRKGNVSDGFHRKHP